MASRLHPKQEEEEGEPADSSTDTKAKSKRKRKRAKPRLVIPRTVTSWYSLCESST